MEETVGTLNLKIARLEQRLQVLAQQQGMSSEQRLSRLSSSPSSGMEAAPGGYVN